MTRDPAVAALHDALRGTHARMEAKASAALADIPAARLAEADERWRLQHGTRPLPPATRLPAVEVA